MKWSTLASVLFLVGGLTAQEHPFGDPVIVHGSRALPGFAAVLDVNLDGHRDIVVGNGFTLAAMNGPMTAYVLDASFDLRREERIEQTGDPGLISHSVIATGDFNGDQLPDLTAVSNRGSVTVHLHTGSADDPTRGQRFKVVKARAQHRIMQQPNATVAQFRTYGIAIGEFTGDGIADVALCGEAASVFESLGYTGLSIFAGRRDGGVDGDSTLATGSIIGLVKADLHGDDDDDLVALSAEREIIVCTNRGRVGFRVDRFHLSTPTKPRHIGLGDYDGDGRIDFLVSGGEAKPELSIYLADVSGMPNERITFDLSAMPTNTVVEGLACTDCDDDGRADLALLLVPPTGEAWIDFYKQGKGKPARIHLPVSLQCSAVPTLPIHLTATDFDGDQNPELIVHTSRDWRKSTMVNLVLKNRTARRVGTQQLLTGTPGTQGIVPKISCVGGRPAVGNPNFTLVVADTPARAQTALVMSTRLEHRRFCGVEIYVFPFYSFGMTTIGTGMRGGSALANLAIPPYRELADYRFYFQWLVVDPGAQNPLGLSSTKALEVRLMSK